MTEPTADALVNIIPRLSTPLGYSRRSLLNKNALPERRVASSLGPVRTLGRTVPAAGWVMTPTFAIWRLNS